MADGYKCLGVILGYRCDFRCKHCNLGPQDDASLQPEEIETLLNEIKADSVKDLLFLGGEPTLYVPLINSILDRIGVSKIKKVRITTNGGFARTVASAKSVLAGFRKLSHVQLSFDRFHSEFLPEANLKNLYQATRELGMDFGVVTAVQSPLDLAMLKQVGRLGKVPIVVQPVLPIGRAKTNGLCYQHTSFNHHVLNKKCPNRNSLVYVCGKGFSICCSVLAFELGLKEVFGRTIGGHLSSGFCRLMKGHTFGQLIKIFGLKDFRFKPEHSLPCLLCRDLFAAAAPAAYR